MERSSKTESKLNRLLLRGKSNKERAAATRLPEWVWRLRTAWVSTLCYQSIRDGFSDYFFDLIMLPSYRKKASRRNFNPDYKLKRHTEKLQMVSGELHDEFGGVESFSYVPLNSTLGEGSTRLLLLHPGDNRSHIRVTLKEHSLESCPPYEALSYTWGNEIYHHIECDGKLLRIRENAWLALQSLRQEARQTRLWIDAICIDQSNLQERTKQVLLMRRIFEQATQVIVWLGPPSPGTQRVFQLLGSLAKASAKETSEERSQSFMADDLERRGFPERSSEVWAEMDIFFWQNWFVRVWIIQEVSVARTILFRCGPYTCPYDQVETASNYIKTHSLTAITGVDPSKFTSLAQFRQDYLGNNPDLARLEVLLCRARTSYSTDPRDKIFAVLGLNRDPSNSTLLAPDYSSDYAHVYTDATRRIIERTRSLDVLSATDDHRSSLAYRLSSWVPDWEVSQPKFLPFCTSTAFNNWKAAGSLIPLFKYSPDGAQLCVTGHIIDTVKYVSDSFVEFSPIPGGDTSAHNLVTRSRVVKRITTNTTDFFSQQRWRQWEKMARNLKTYPTGEPIIDVFVKAITAGHDFGPGHSTRELYDSWKKIWEDITLGDGRLIEIAHKSVTQAELSDAMRFAETHWKAGFGRRLFTTSKGYMGMGLGRGLRAGMYISILAGGRTPYVLRKRKDDRYTFCGECYVHGAMKGELCPGPERAMDIWLV